MKVVRISKHAMLQDKKKKCSSLRSQLLQENKDKSTPCISEPTVRLNVENMCWD